MKRLIGCIAVGMLTLTACSSPEETEETQETTLTVFAAASLHEVFEEIGEVYTEATGVEVEFNFAGSSGLVEQLENGAPADVLATADEANMEAAAQADLVSGDPELFAQNHLVIVTPPGNPAQISSLADLDAGHGSGAEVVVCAEQVPCGAATKRLTDASGVELDPVSEELSVTDVLGRVRSQEAEAGLVYTTDALHAADEVESIEIEGAAEDPNRYPIALLAEADSPEAGQEFIDVVLQDDRSRQVLQDAGFADPS